MEFLSNIHPLVVHFPIALLMLYCLLEIVSVFYKADYINKSTHLLLFLGVLSAVVAVLTGNSAAGDIIDKSKIETVLEAHEEFANLLLWFFTLVLGLRTFLILKNKINQRIKFFLVIAAIAGLVLIYLTAAEGGRMVYEFGVGTKMFDIN